MKIKYKFRINNYYDAIKNRDRVLCRDYYYLYVKFATLHFS